MANFVYVDNSNLWIEGMHLSAVVHGLAPNILVAQQEKISDFGWKLDFGRLYEFATGGGAEVGRAVIFGSTPPTNGSLWAEARRRGFEVVLHERNAYGREKKVDTSIATTIMADSYERMQAGTDEITIVSGDTDYVPTVEHLRDRGFDVFVAFWQHASRELRQACTSFVPMNGYFDYLRLR